MAEEANAGVVRSQLSLDVSQWLQGLRQAQSATDAFQQRLSQVRLPDFQLNTGQHTQGLRQMEQSVQATQTAFSGMTASIVRGGLALAGIYSGLQLVRSGVSGLVDSAVQLQRLDAAFTAITGSSAGAQRSMEFVRTTADRLGFSVLALANAYKGFEAASQGTVLAGAETQRIFTSIVTAGRALQLSQNDIQGVLLAVQQIMSKGTVSSEELRQQLGERLPGAFQIAARAMGVTTAELSKMLETGSVLSTTFLPRFASQLQRELGQNAAAGVRTFTESFARLGNAFTEVGGTLNKSGVLTWLGSVVDKLADIIKAGPDAAKALEDVQKSIGQQETRPLAQRGLAATPQEEAALGKTRTDLEQTRADLRALEARKRELETRQPPELGVMALLNDDIRAATARIADLEQRLATVRQQTTTAAEQRRDVAGLGEPPDVGEAFQRGQEVSRQVRQIRQEIQTQVQSISEQLRKADDEIAGATSGQQRLKIWQDLLEKIDEAIKKLNSTIAGSGVSELLRATGAGALPALPQREQETIRRIAQTQNVDPEFLAALRRAENGGPGREFGVLSVSAPTYEDQARIAAQTIAANRQRFEAQGRTAVDPTSGRYTPDFIRFFSNVYAPLGAANDPTGLNQAHAGNLLRFYGAGGTEGPLQALEGIRGTLLQRVRDAEGDLTKTNVALGLFAGRVETITAGLRTAREEVDWRDPLTRNIDYLQEFLTRLEAGSRLDFIDPKAEAAFTVQLASMRKQLAEFQQERERLQGLGVLPTDPLTSARNQIRQRIENEQKTFLAGLAQDQASLRAQLTIENLALQQPDLAQQLGITLQTEAGRAIPSARAQTAARLLPQITALPEDQQAGAIRAARILLDLQDRLYGEEALQNITQQTSALQARLRVMGQSLVAQQREALVQEQIQRLIDRGIPVEPKTEAAIRSQAGHLVQLQHALEGAQRPLQAFGEKYESTFVKIQETTLGALQKTESALVDFFSTGKFDFAGLMQGILRDLQQMTTRTLFTKPLAGALDSLFNNTGAGGFLRGLVDKPVELAQGGLVTRPTLALLGERGPEWVVPMAEGGMVDWWGDTASTAEARTAIEARRAALEAIYAEAERRFQRSRYAGFGAAVGSGLGAALANLIPAQDVNAEQRDYENQFVARTDRGTGHIFIHGIDASSNINWASRVPGAVGYVRPPQIDTMRQIGRQILGLIGSLAGAYAGSAAGSALRGSGGVGNPPTNLAGDNAQFALGGIAGLQRGGRVHGPTLALIGEAGPEAVVPLKRGGIPAMTDQYGRLMAHLPSGVEIPILHTPRFADGALVNGGYTAMSPAMWASMPQGTNGGRMGTGPMLNLTMHVHGVQDTQGFRATESQVMRRAAQEFQRQWARNS
jgi:tape measure domain-containing protein